ncbi:GGDEF domain-containing response regulator [Dapis sp. BLCC M172]|uniref:GGDEF domain-containing response regulator n=1 Tax=Dapis sp. BLCC M172 TaxID=2975281 RepID=UPI003CF5BEC3
MKLLSQYQKNSQIATYNVYYISNEKKTMFRNNHVNQKKSLNTLLVEDNPGDAFLIKQLLKIESSLNFNVAHCDRLSLAIKQLNEEKIDVILLDLGLPDSQGFETISHMIEIAPNIPIIVLTGRDDEDFSVQVVQKGAQDYLVKSEISAEVLIRSIRYSLERIQLVQKLQQREQELSGFTEKLADEVLARTYELKQQNEKLQHLLKISNTDPLTGIPNRYCWETVLERDWKKSIRESQPISLIMMDIDFFKLFNDTYGHPKGDICLKKVAQVIQKTLKRSTDLVARYGGEEFVVVLPNTDKSGAMFVAESIRTEVNSLKIIHEASKVDKYITISLGLATTIPTINSHPDELISQADKGLYIAKENGRNCVRYSHHDIA